MDKKLNPEEMSDEELDKYVVDLMSKQDILFNENLRLEDEFQKEANNYDKLAQKITKLKNKSDQITKKSEKLLKKIELAKTSKFATSILSLIFSFLLIIASAATGQFNLILFTTLLVSLASTPLISKYEAQKIEEYENLGEDVEKVLQLANMYQAEEYRILDAQKKLTAQMGENFANFMDINDELDKIEGVDTLAELSAELDEELAKHIEDLLEGQETEDNIIDPQ